MWLSGHLNVVNCLKKMQIELIKLGFGYNWQEIISFFLLKLWCIPHWRSFMYTYNRFSRDEAYEIATKWREIFFWRLSLYFCLWLRDYLEFLERKQNNLHILVLRITSFTVLRLTFYGQTVCRNKLNKFIHKTVSMPLAAARSQLTTWKFSLQYLAFQSCPLDIDTVVSHKFYNVWDHFTLNGFYKNKLEYIIILFTNQIINFDKKLSDVIVHHSEDSFRCPISIKFNRAQNV